MSDFEMRMLEEAYAAYEVVMNDIAADPAHDPSTMADLELRRRNLALEYRERIAAKIATVEPVTLT